MRSLIVPVAGKSSRFPGMAPKWLLTHPNGNLMVVEAILGLNLEDFDKVVIVMLEEHAHLYRPQDGIMRALKSLRPGVERKLEFVELKQATRHQPETVALGIRSLNIKGAVAVKDSDNYFSFQVLPDNSVAVARLASSPVYNASAKSYVVTNYEGVLSTIVEKQVVSDQFCTGCYSFQDADEFLATYDTLTDYSDLYISHIIYKMVLDGKIFVARECKNFQDWGTITEWNRFKRQYGAVFVDIDGVLFEKCNQWIPPFWKEAKVIEENVAHVNSLYLSGKVKVVLTTSRPDNCRKATEEQLSTAKISYHDIIFNMPEAQKVIVNAFGKSDPFPVATAINIQQNSHQLSDMLNDTLGSKL